MNSYFKESSLAQNQVEYIIKKAGFQLKSGVYIERNREANCTLMTITRWCSQFAPDLKSYENYPELMFNFDESMIQITNKKEKFILFSGGDRPLISKPEQRRHISIGCCFNAVGFKLPLTIIFSGIKNIEASIISSHPDNLYASNSSGYMTSEMFYAWARFFCETTLNYRQSLPKDKRSKKIILILDSHSSRYSLDAIRLFNKCHIKVITLPPHCTHVLQPYDVGIAKELKAQFSIEYRDFETKLLNAKAVQQSNKDEENSQKPQLQESDYRVLVAEAMSTAWNKVVNAISAGKAFALSGLYPFNPKIAMAARGVNCQLNIDPEKELRRRQQALHITSTELTDPLFMEKMREYEETKKQKKLNKKEGETKKEEEKKEDIGTRICYTYQFDLDTLIIKTEALINESETRKKPKQKIAMVPINF